MRFIAIAMVSCASRLIEPSDAAPVAKRLTIRCADSTSSIEIGLPGLKSSRPRIVQSRRLSWSIRSVNSSKVLKLFVRVECCSRAIVSGLYMWYSPSRRHW